MRILIVDDHPMTVRGYEMFLMGWETNYCFEIESAYNCDDVLDKMKEYQDNFYDMVLLDISLPPSFDGSVTSGEDMGERIKQNFPETKIIVHTALTDQQRISNIFKTLNPEGFLIKTEITPEILKDAVNAVLNGHSYYSEWTNKSIGHNIHNEIYVDSLDRKILYYLSLGERMKDLPEHIPLSMASIERRKKNLKMLFGIPNENDKRLLEIAREKGYI